MSIVRFEGIVRPNETRDITPPKVSTGAVAEVGEDTVKFEWGKGNGGGGVNAINWTYSLGVTRYMTKQQREQQQDLNAVFPANG